MRATLGLALAGLTLAGSVAIAAPAGAAPPKNAAKLCAQLIAELDYEGGPYTLVTWEPGEDSDAMPPTGALSGPGIHGDCVSLVNRGGAVTVYAEPVE